jgi:hypothetical protein
MSRKTTLALTAAEDLRDYCNEVRQFSGAEFKHLTVASRELQATLAPHGRIRARIVAAYLKLAANSARIASGHAVATYLAFLAKFDEEIALARRKSAKKRKPNTGGPNSDGFKFGAK